jgi:hypothetical protein
VHRVSLRGWALRLLWRIHSRATAVGRSAETTSAAARSPRLAHRWMHRMARCAARFEHSSGNAVPSGTASCAVATWKQWAECGADQTNASV